MVPPYRVPEPTPSSPGRRGRIVAGVATAILAGAAGLWSVLSPAGPGTPPGCVDVAVASTTGGLVVRHCGTDATAWCARQAHATGTMADRARAACRAAGVEAAAARPVP